MFYCPNCNNIFDIGKTPNAPDNKDNKDASSFICTNCGYSKPIEPGTNLYTRLSDDQVQLYSSNDYSNIVHNDTLPRTRNYTCPNKNCSTHKSPGTREAVFFRKSNTYKVVYICTVCETSF